MGLPYFEMERRVVSPACLAYCRYFVPTAHILSDSHKIISIMSVYCLQVSRVIDYYNFPVAFHAFGNEAYFAASRGSHRFTLARAYIDPFIFYHVYR